MSGHSLFRKYVVVFVVLVSGALLTSGLVQLYFSYQESQTALVELEREKAATAATRIEQFVAETERLLNGATQAPLVGAPRSAEQWRDDYLRLLRQAPAVTELSHLDSAGREQVRVSRLAMNVIGGQADFSADPKFVEARQGHTYFGPVYFRSESEPYMTISLLEAGPDAGVTSAEVNLKFIWDVVSRIQIGQAGYAYVVDANGQLVAHPDISLVLQRADLSDLPQVQAARSDPDGPPRDEPAIARDLQGRQVLTARERIDPPGWSVFVEQPLEEVFAPLYASVLRTVLLLLVGLVLAVLASLVLARRMVRPIQRLQAGAAQIGGGALDQRIALHTGDELEALGESFNQMSARLRESYATLEQRVAERTHDLAAALERLRALGEVSQTVSSTLDLQQVLTTIVGHAVQLSGADAGAIYAYDEAGQEFHLRATHGMSAEFIAAIRETPIRLGEAVVGEAAARRAPVQVPDVQDEPGAPVREVLRRAGFRALLALPLLREERIIGALVVRRRAAGLFGQDTLDLLQTFASHSALAIENARLFEEIARKGQQLEVASRHKSEFLANMSHELRTPLNAIIGFSQVLADQLFGQLNPKQEEYVRDIVDSGRHLLSLINDILDLSKVEAGRMELELGTFSLPEALDNGLTMVRERASRHGIALSLEVDPAIGLVEADERKVKQVIFNLLSNAVKFTPDGGRVDLAARLVGEEIHVAVRDTGIGIAPEDQVRIFEDFQQVGRNSTSSQEGTGLGLALARRFVELHGGRLWVDSQVGAGSTFTFSLPVRVTVSTDAEPSREAGRPDAARLASGPGQPVTPGRSAGLVLLVEDNLQSIDLLSLYLRADGFEVAVASDGQAALELAGQLQPAAIVLDILLPRVDGWDVLARAKADPSLAHIPVVIVSMLDERGKGFALGAAEYLVKPVSRDELISALRRIRLVDPIGSGTTRVLAIDDDPMALELIEAILRPEGYTVLKAAGGQEGVALARREVPALVILDLLMPEVDGFGVVEQLRADPATARIPIVLLTSASMAPEDKQRLNGHLIYLARKSEFNRAAFVELVSTLCPVAIG